MNFCRQPRIVFFTTLLFLVELGISAGHVHQTHSQSRSDTSDCTLCFVHNSFKTLVKPELGVAPVEWRVVDLIASPIGTEQMVARHIPAQPLSRAPPVA